MKYISGLLFLSALCNADQPAVAPAYEAPAPEYGAPVAQETYSAPVPQYSAPVPDTYGAPAAPAAAAPESYGSPAAPPVAGGDAYGSPAAPPVTGGDSYGSPAAPVQSTAPVGNQGYYYYYYPVRQNAPAPVESEDDNGILSIITALLTKKIIIVAVGIVAFLVITALGINVAVGRSFSSSTARAFELAEPYITEDNLIALADFVNKSLGKFQ